MVYHSFAHLKRPVDRGSIRTPPPYGLSRVVTSLDVSANKRGSGTVDGARKSPKAGEKSCEETSVYHWRNAVRTRNEKNGPLGEGLHSRFLIVHDGQSKEDKETALSRDVGVTADLIRT